jgi:deazaflavin-dependent oxidoreductase (nitroreductase family)
MTLPTALARFNRSVTNRAARLVAGQVPGLGIVTHRGRVSGRTYTTPVLAFRRPGGYVFALTYGQGDWVRNVLHAGSAELLTRGRIHRLGHPRIDHDPSHAAFPRPIAAILRLLDVDEALVTDELPDDG